MKKLFHLFFFVSITGMAALFWRSFRQVNYFACLPVEFIPNENYPTVTFEIQGKNYPLLVDSGTGAFIHLRTTYLQAIQKEYIQTLTSFDIRNNNYEYKQYKIDEVKINSIKMRNILVSEDSDFFYTDGSLIGEKMSEADILETNLGRIGRGILARHNLCFDFHHSALFFCYSLDKLKKAGYDLDSFISVPFEISDKEGIILVVETDVGPKRFFIDTGCTHSIIRPKEVEGRELTNFYQDIKKYRSDAFVINGRDFGPINFIVWDFPVVFESFDAILGMNFLKEHVIYFDYGRKIAHVAKAAECIKDKEKLMKETESARKDQKKLELRWKYPGSDSKIKILGLGSVDAYFWMKEKPYDAYFPITFVTEDEIPAVTVNIENRPYLLKLATGSFNDISFEFEIIKKLKRELIRVDTTYDEKWTQYQAKVYRLPLVTIGDLEIVYPEVFEGVDGKIAQDVGDLGRGVLTKMNLFLDLQNQAMFFCSNLNMRKKEGYIPDAFIAVPFEQDMEGEIVIRVETDLGPKHFLIETERPNTLIRASDIDGQEFVSNIFRIGRKDFGKQRLIAENISPNFTTVDAILGLDFLKKHVFYFDFSKKIVYIS